MDNKKIGTFIAERRKELGYNQKELAEKLNVTDKAVSKWETGRSAPDVSMLIPLSSLLEISVTELLNGERIKKEELQAVSDSLIVETMKPKKLNPLHIIAVIYALISIQNLFPMLSLTSLITTVSDPFEAICFSIPILLILSLITVIGFRKTISTATATAAICTNVPPMWLVIALLTGGINRPLELLIIAMADVFILILTIIKLLQDAKLWNGYKKPNHIGTVKKAGSIIVFIMFAISICFYLYLSLDGALSILPQDLQYAVRSSFFNIDETVIFPVAVFTAMLLISAFCTLIFYRKDFSKATVILFSCGILAFPIQFISMVIPSVIDFMVDNSTAVGIYYTTVSVLFAAQLVATAILFIKDFRENDFE